MAKANTFSKYDVLVFERRAKIKCTESPLKTGGLSFDGIPASDSPTGTVALAPAPAGDR